MNKETIITILGLTSLISCAVIVPTIISLFFGWYGLIALPILLIIHCLIWAFIFSKIDMEVIAASDLYGVNK